MKVSLPGRLSPIALIGAAIACMAFAVSPVRSDPQAAAAASQDDGAAAADYRIHASDELDFSVLGHDELKCSVIVLPDGFCSFPGVGTMHVAGRTELELTSLLEKKLAYTINSPDVTIIIRPSISAVKVSIIGAVKAPGQYPVDRDTRLIDVIALAGGLTQDPDATDILVVNPGGVTSHRIDAVRLMASSDLSQNILLRAGDVILVQALDIRWLAIQVAGEVVRPGAFDVPKSGVLLPAALAMAGGPLPTAALTKAQILHEGHARTVDLSGIVLNLADNSAQERLLPGDVLQLPVNLDRFAVVGMVKNPGPQEMAEGTRMTVAEAIVNAGGILESADLMKCALVRQDATGKPAPIPIDVGRILSGKDVDHQIERGDIIFIPARHGTPASASSWVAAGGGLAALYSVFK